MFDLVKTLTELPGPMGQEELVHEWCARHWEPIAEHVEITMVGNVIAKIGGSGPPLLVLAHGDELTLMVRSITENGLLRVWPAWADRRGRPQHWYNPVNQPVVVMSESGPLDGQLCYASGHVIGGDSNREHFIWDDWFVDLGFFARDRVVELGVHAGTRVTINPQTRRLGETIVGKAMDNRAAIAIATSVAERADISRLRHELWVGSSVQEENGLIGASSFPDAGSFSYGIALDVGLCGDVPGTSAESHPAKLGGGPLLVHQDASTHYSHRLTMAMVDVGAAKGIPVQQAIFQNYGSDGAALIRRGIETALLTFPTRYTHSPNEMVVESDLVQCVDLILGYLERSPLPVRWPK
jgi:tetrahedral aminopeptidase